MLFQLMHSCIPFVSPVNILCGFSVSFLVIHNHILQASIFRAWFQLQHSVFGELVQLALAFQEAKKVIQQSTNINNNKLVGRCYHLTMCFVLTEKIS